jgi:hypothetical protein
VSFEAGDVPCFWACGVTGNLAVSNAQLPYAITHSPGNMFITDLQVTCMRRRSGSWICSAYAGRQRIFGPLALQESLAFPASVGAAVVGGYATSSMACINRLETLALRDPGKRGIAHLARTSELWHAACDLLKATRVIITTGWRVLLSPVGTLQ